MVERSRGRETGKWWNGLLSRVLFGQPESRPARELHKINKPGGDHVKRMDAERRKPEKEKRP